MNSRDGIMGGENKTKQWQGWKTCILTSLPFWWGTIRKTFLRDLDGVQVFIISSQ